MSEQTYKEDLREVLDQVKEGNRATAELTKTVTDMRINIAEITKELKLRPQNDKEQHDHILTKTEYIESDVEALKANQRWFVITIIGLFLVNLWDIIVNK